MGQLKSSDTGLFEGKDAEVVPVKGTAKRLYRVQVNGISDKREGRKLCAALKSQLGFCKASLRG